VVIRKYEEGQADKKEYKSRVAKDVGIVIHTILSLLLPPPLPPPPPPITPTLNTQSFLCASISITTTITLATSLLPF